MRQHGEGTTPLVLLTGGPGYSGDYLEDMAARFSARHRVADVEALRVLAGSRRLPGGATFADEPPEAYD